MKTLCVGGPLHGRLVDSHSSVFHAHDETNNCCIIPYRKHQFVTQNGDLKEYFHMFVYGPLEEQGEKAMLEQVNIVLEQRIVDVMNQLLSDKTT